MSDRKYRQRGYQDSDRPEKRSSQERQRQGRTPKAVRIKSSVPLRWERRHVSLRQFGQIIATLDRYGAEHTAKPGPRAIAPGETHQRRRDGVRRVAREAAQYRI